jgi:hypothetical protein
MRLRAFLLLILLSSPCLYSVPAQKKDSLRTPATGSAERKAIMDSLRGNFKEQAGSQVTFKVHYIKVHNGWAWVDVTPLDDKGKAVAEGGPSLLHYEAGSWKVMDLPELPEDPDDPMPAEDASPRFIKAAQKKYQTLPADIFPKTRK